mgnify:CR=1 FL=1
MAVYAELLRRKAERQADELRQVQDWHLQAIDAGIARGVGLLGVQVEVAERTGRDQAVSPFFLRLAEVVCGHGQRVLLVDRQDREAAALVLTLVSDQRATERLDDVLKVVVAVRVLFLAEELARAREEDS